jgi:uncharacterized protein YdeI (YjbR/CyaY-like superfamily)
MTPPAEPTYFATPADFRAWLAAHADTDEELIVGFHKVGSGQPSMTWPESVDEALCFGWIDGVRRRVDELRYQIRFTPRRPGSIWSAVNIGRVEALTAEGRMQPAGLAAFARRTEGRSRVYTHEQHGDPELPPALARRFKAEKAAWRFFEAQPPGWKRTVLRWVLAAKQAATQERRLAQLIAAAAEGRRL